MKHPALHRFLSAAVPEASPFFSRQYKADLVTAFSHRVLPHFSRSLRPVIDSTFSLENIAEAHRHMEANRNTGKIVINMISQNQTFQ